MHLRRSRDHDIDSLSRVTRPLRGREKPSAQICNPCFHGRILPWKQGSTFSSSQASRRSPSCPPAQLESVSQIEDHQSAQDKIGGLLLPPPGGDRCGGPLLPKLRQNIRIYQVPQNFTLRGCHLRRGTSKSTRPSGAGRRASLGSCPVVRPELRPSADAPECAVRRVNFSRVNSSFVSKTNSRFRRCTICGPSVSALSRTALN